MDYEEEIEIWKNRETDRQTDRQSAADRHRGRDTERGGDTERAKIQEKKEEEIQTERGGGRRERERVCVFWHFAES